MKQYDVETVCTYRTWVRVDADDEKAAERKVMTRIQYQSMMESKPTGTVRDVG